MTLKVDGIGTNPIYLNNSYPITNSFRGDYAQTNSVSLDTSQLNTTNIAPLEKDTLNISASDKIKTQQKEKGMSTATKVGLTVVGALATTYACVVGHRMLTKPSIEKVAQNFSEIFRRDVSKDEAQKIVKRYEEILNIENPEEFYKKAFEQIKKDYGYEKTPINLQINKTRNYSDSGNASWNNVDARLEVNVFSEDGNSIKAMKKRGKKCVLQRIMHEFQHVKQTEIGYRTSRNNLAEAIHNQNRTVSAMITNAKCILKNKTKLKQFAKESGITVDECKKKLEESIKLLESKKDEIKISFDKTQRIKLDDLWEKLPKYDKKSDEYKMGLKYIDNTKHYITSSEDRKKYETQLLEAEAFGCEEKFEKIYNYFANPWRIPWFQ